MLLFVNNDYYTILTNVFIIFIVNLHDIMSPFKHPFRLLNEIICVLQHFSHTFFFSAFFLAFEKEI